MGSWVVHAKAQTVKPGKDFRTLNRASVQAGNTTTKDLSEFKKTHDIRFQASTGTQRSKGNPIPSHLENVCFGRKNEASTPVGELFSFPEPSPEQRQKHPAEKVIVLVS